MSELPFVDEYSVDVDASPQDLWGALVKMFGGTSLGPAGKVLARVLGCEDTEARGPRPLAPGSALPGFHVVAADAPNSLILDGRHRFARYRLTFTIDAREGGGARLRAGTRAEFPGPVGSLYRAAVIGSGGHTLLVRRFLAGLKTAAEKGSSAASPA